MQEQGRSGKLHRKHFRLQVEMRRPSLSDRGPANGSAIRRPRPSAAEIAVMAIASTPQAAARASLMTAWPRMHNPTPWIK